MPSLAGYSEAESTVCDHLILRSIAQSSLPTVRCVSKDEVDTDGPPSWFETARAPNIMSNT